MAAFGRALQYTVMKILDEFSMIFRIDDVTPILWNLAKGHDMKLPDPRVIVKIKDELLGRNRTAHRPGFAPYREEIQGYDMSHVSVFLHTRSLVDFDEITGVMKVSGILLIQWYDERITWNETQIMNDHNISLNYIPFRLSEIWNPKVFLFNSLREFEMIDNRYRNQLVWFNATGNATYIHGDVYTTTCDPSVKWFPFDVHECEIRFIALDELKFLRPENDHEIHIADPLNIFRNVNILDNDVKWDYRVLQPCVVKLGDSHLSVAVFTFRLQRRHAFVVTNTVIPIYIFTLLNLFVYFVPVEEGEKVSLAMTVLLSFTVFIVLVTENIPETGDPIPIICFFLVFKLGCSSAIAITNIISTELFYKHDTCIIPRCTERFVVFMERLTAKDSYHQTKEGAYVLGRQGSISSDYVQSRSNVETMEATAKSPVTWKRLVYALDKLFFLTFTVVFVLESIFCLSIYFSETVNRDLNAISTTCQSGSI